jgi:excisionase family DNA binding protein
MIADRVVARIGTPAASPLMKPEEAAAYLRKTKQAIYHMIHNGDLIPTRHGSKVYLKKTELDRWIETKSSDR